MGQNFGSEIVTRRTKNSTLIWLRISAVASFLLFGVAGAYFVLNPIDAEDTLFGFIALGAAVIFPIFLLIISVRLRAEVKIYENGVAVVKGNNKEKLHFSEIAGLRDAATSGGTIFVSGDLGIVGALIAGAAQGIAGNALDASRRRNRIRSLSIVPKASGAKEIGVVNTGGDELSQIYTDWLMAQASVTPDNINSISLNFGENLNLNNGILTHKHRRGEDSVALNDIISLNITENSLQFVGINEKGKERPLIDINFTNVLNIDLLFMIYEMSAQDEGASYED